MLLVSSTLHVITSWAGPTMTMGSADLVQVAWLGLPNFTSIYALDLYPFFMLFQEENVRYEEGLEMSRRRGRRLKPCKTGLSGLFSVPNGGHVRLEGTFDRGLLNYLADVVDRIRLDNWRSHNPFTLCIRDSNKNCQIGSTGNFVDWPLLSEQSVLVRCFHHGASL